MKSFYVCVHHKLVYLNRVVNSTGALCVNHSLAGVFTAFERGLLVEFSVDHIHSMDLAVTRKLSVN